MHLTPTCFEAKLVLLLAVVVIQRSDSHAFSRLFIKGVRSSISVVARVRSSLVLIRPLGGGCVCLVLLIAAHTEKHTVQLFLLIVYEQPSDTKRTLSPLNSTKYFLILDTLIIFSFHVCACSPSPVSCLSMVHSLCDIC